MTVQQRYDAIYLSPHFDDAAYSCAGQIWQRTAAGERILLVTIMAADPPEGQLSPFAQELHDRWRLTAAAVAARREEDAAACRLIGADWRHGPLSDCIYRRSPETGEPLYPDAAALFAAVHPAEDGLRRELAQWLAQLPPAREWFVPLTVGSHVDHQLTRQAAEMATLLSAVAGLQTASAGWLGRRPATAGRIERLPLYYYEDYPYAQKPGAVELALGEEANWEAITVPLSEAAVQIRYQAAAVFASQFSTFFVDWADMERQIGGYIEAVGGERYYIRGDDKTAD